MELANIHHVDKVHSNHKHNDFKVVYFFLFISQTSGFTW